MNQDPTGVAPQLAPDYREVSLSPRRLIGSIPIPRELLLMPEIDLAADVRYLLEHGEEVSRGPDLDRMAYPWWRRAIGFMARIRWRLPVVVSAEGEEDDE